MTYLSHITLTIVHSRRSDRWEVADFLMPAVMAVLSKAMAGDKLAIPGVAGDYALSAAAEGRCLIATV